MDNGDESEKNGFRTVDCKWHGDLGSLFEDGSANAAAAAAVERHSRRTVVIISSLLGHSSAELDRQPAIVSKMLNT
jgi:hypothetical protein